MSPPPSLQLLFFNVFFRGTGGFCFCMLSLEELVVPSLLCSLFFSPMGPLAAPRVKPTSSQTRRNIKRSNCRTSVGSLRLSHPVASETRTAFSARLFFLSMYFFFPPEDDVFISQALLKCAQYFSVFLFIVPRSLLSKACLFFSGL